ncbi:DUF6630 family protein [Nocardia stercoris]|uniref:DUF6630 domain-containing protein n=2 Tax=Nocardia stercoris TaxID=2483361 RepID=A0A3M2L0H6_9NOCA|nr:hypothetical protein EBN03_17790 [Nocardia stercoris]
MAYFLAGAEQGFPLDADDVVDSLIRQGVLLPVDWSGEERTGQIAQFVAGRVAAFGKGRAVVAAVESAATQAAEADLERGEHVPAVLRAVDEALASAGLALGALRSGDDTYRVGVMRRTAASSSAWGLDRPSSESLYIIDCPCGGTNVWQLPETEAKPAEGECDSCGRDLFDPAGTPIVPMVVEPVR